jgi:hypothetical protein
MKNIFSKLFQTLPLKLPASVEEAFYSKFGNSLNVEWLEMDDFYEAIFYIDDDEHISRFDSTGKIINVKKNLKRESTPLLIRQVAESHGELMNVIEISDNEIVAYELIVRDSSLTRFSVKKKKKGGLIQKTKL